MSSASSTLHSGPGKDSSDGRGLGGELVTPEDNSPRFARLQLRKSRLRGSTGPGLSEDDPIVLVISGLDHDENLSRSEHNAFCLAVYYRLYKEEGAVASKTSFDSEEFSLGRINILSVAPPRTVARLKSRVMQAEGLSSFWYNIQLFKDIDGEVPMNGNDPVCHPQAYNYPGCVADEPITIIYEHHDEAWDR
ncbi:uncharacterized protein LACBIDRAFT_328793 [Laccaria bicolor S238N-H82]|uniref:Predicted protein n=1 Tax=Laccaria bicolor (strain S238N-H82 / ATCC MYA-4686) TaxID=486041 RepID=B0DG02_LACBS|nr:uncharacterized protein LACBIDRAFT_328793 [Laccaria bicolor S238N-H82]EDR06553.1 predicted protein [Laccaria bicolor S238N-H82]|eukprot:XP_001882925.1 predicted protein [Laccaria bicolor S238N-H82]